MSMLMYMYMMGVGLVSFVMNKYYLLMMLMSLEYLSVVMFFFMNLSLICMGTEGYLLMIYLVFCVCEGALGLCLLVMMIRCYGNNYVSSLSLLKC